MYMHFRNYANSLFFTCQNKCNQVILILEIIIIAMKSFAARVSPQVETLFSLIFYLENPPSESREKRRVQKENPPCRRIFFLVRQVGLEPTRR